MKYLEIFCTVIKYATAESNVESQIPAKHEELPLYFYHFQHFEHATHHINSVCDWQRWGHIAHIVIHVASLMFYVVYLI